MQKRQVVPDRRIVYNPAYVCGVGACQALWTVGVLIAGYESEYVIADKSYDADYLR